MIDGIASSNLDSGTNPLTHTDMNATTVELTKASFDANFHKHGTYQMPVNLYDEYIVSKEVFNQLCPKEYQDNKVHSCDEHAMKATTDRVIIHNKITGDRLTIVCI